MAKVLFIHSPNMHEAHRMFAEALYSPSGQSPWGKMLRGSGRKRFLSLLTRKLKVFRRFVEAFKRAKEYPNCPIIYLKVECRCSRF